MTIHNNLMDAGDLPRNTRTGSKCALRDCKRCETRAHLPCPQHHKQHLAPCEPATDFIGGIPLCVTPLPDSYLPQRTQNAGLSLLLFCKSSIICI